MREPHHFGPLCEYGTRARGSAPAALFGGAWEVRKAEARFIRDWEFETGNSRLGIRDWEFEASHLIRPRYASWDLAMRKELHCDVRGLEFVCAASAHPCRRR
jgi:hypothetical protein